MDPIDQLVQELESDPSRFRATGGYDRLLDLLRNGYPPDALRRVLAGDANLVGDLLWTIAELDDVAPFASEAERHLWNDDQGTAAYAMEVVLRGSQEKRQLLAALDRLRSCDVVVCEHAVRTLAGEGLNRLVDILKAIDVSWSPLVEELSNGPIPIEVMKDLIAHSSRDRQVVGLVLVTLACERDESVAECLTHSKEMWIREYGKWLLDK